MIIRFGVFEANLSTGELWKQSRKLELQDQPFQLLALLLRNAGELVSREELRKELWPSDSFGEFDEGLNTAVRKIRKALGDDAANPRFIETLARRGYRFIAPVAGLRAAPVEEASIAVLPFENSGGGQDEEIFSDGLTEDLINTLARFRGLKVTSRTSAFAFKGKPQDLRKIGEALGVAHVLEGGVRRGGSSRIRVNVQLIRAADGNILWSERFDRELTNVFAIQDEISQAIIAALRVNLAGRPGEVNSKSRGTTNAQAYQALLEGRYFCGRPSRQNLARGQAAFSRAIELDARYAEAYAGLATANLFQAYQRFAPSTEASRYAERAIELDDGCAEGYLARAQIRGMFQYDWAGAAEDFERAAKWNPSGAEVWDIRGVMDHRVFGRLESALAAHERAVQLDPLAPFPRTNVAYTLHLMGRREEALEHSRTTLEMFPDNPLVQHHACLIYHAAGLTKEAAAMARRDVAADAGHMLGWSSAACLVRGKDEAVQLLEGLEDLAAGRQAQLMPGLFCLPWKEAGDTGRALEWAKRAFDEHDVHFLVEFRDPCFSELRCEPRFRDLLQAIGLA